MSDYYLTNKELYHYGIKGQQWGTRRWQNDDGSFNEEGKIRYGRVSQEKLNKKLKDEYKNLGKENPKKDSKMNNDEKPRENGKYSKDAEYYKKRGEIELALMSAAGVLISAYGAYRIYKNSGKRFYDKSDIKKDLYIALFGIAAVRDSITAFKQRTADKRLLENSEFKKVEDIPRSRTNYSKNYFDSKEEGSNASKELRHNINPGYPNIGSNKNCMLCTTALIMRLKGYDVQANTTDDGFDSYKPEDWFDNCNLKKINRKTSLLDIERELKSQGNGSYGNLMVSWKMSVGGGGHSVLYAVRNGKVEFIDGQTNQTYTLEKFFKYVDMNDVSYINLTNAVPKDIVAGLVKSNK